MKTQLSIPRNPTWLWAGLLMFVLALSPFGVWRSVQATPPYTQHLIASSFDGAYTTDPADIDGDGDVDVVGGAKLSDIVAWFENADGYGQTWTAHTVDGLDDVYSLVTADVNADGFMDIIAGGQDYGPIVWWENSNGNGFVWTRHSVGTLIELDSVYAADVDGDGDTDIPVSAGSVSHQVGWWENVNGDGLIWSMHNIGTYENGATSARTADIDEDGDLDIFSSSSTPGSVKWWTNGNSWARHDIDNNFSGAKSTFAADVNGDGHVDILGASVDGEVAWWQNLNGSGLSWAKHSVATNLGYTRWVHGADMDQDGDIDILGALTDIDQIAWWENVASDGTTWSLHTVDEMVDGPMTAVTADFNGDNRPDVLGVAYNADFIAWWSNDAPNVSPVANDDAYSVAEDTTLAVFAPGVLGNDEDVNNDPLTAILIDGPDHGNLTLNADGSFDYTPQTNYYGPDSFTYVANDGLTDSNVATVHLTIISIQDPVVYVSSSTGGATGGVSFADEDVMAYDLVTGLWFMVFDGSDVGLAGVDVDAFSLQPDGSLLLSLDDPLVVGSLGLVDDSDIVRFLPTSLGPTTAGTFELFWDGSAYGLTVDSEDVDALAFAPDGSLLVSTIGNLSVDGLTAQDEDLSALDITTGAWSLYFDGSDVGLADANSEDVNGAAINQSSGDIYLTTLGVFDVPGVSGDGADVLLCVPASLGSTTDCAYSLFWDGSAHGFGGEIMDAMEVGFPTTPLLWLSAQTHQAIGSLAFNDEDIFAYDQASGIYAMVFDGSDVGVTGDVDAFSRQADGSLLLSLDAAVNLPDVGLVDDSDVVRFLPVTLGMTTVGTFELFFDGSAYDLTDDGEDIDGLALSPEGHLLLSTIGPATVAGLTAEDEDIIALDLATGSWTMYFDGSDVALDGAGEDVNGAWVNADASQVYLTTVGAFDVPGATGDGSDILLCQVASLGDMTGCAYSLYWDGSTHGVTSVLDGVEVIMP